MQILNTQIEKDGHVIGFSAVPPERARDLWPSIEHHAEMALSHAFDDMKPEHILGWILKDVLVLVIVTIDDKITASMTLEMVETKRGKICHIMTLGGSDMETWVDEWLKVWIAIAREQGADWITIKGREGWARFARRRGFEHEYTQMQLYIGGTEQ